MPIDLGTGASITFGTGGWTLSVRGMSDVGMEVASVDTTHLTTTDAMTYIAGRLKEGGTVSLDVLHDNDNRPVVANANETVTITFANGAVATFQGHVQSYKIGVPLEQMLTATCVIKVSGLVVWT
jgi:hypothetical protein